MSDHDVVHDAVERLEWSERNDEPAPGARWRGVTRRTALTGGAAGVTAGAINTNAAQRFRTSAS